MKPRELNQSLTILAVIIVPFAIALLVVRGILVGHMLTAAHFENVPLAPGLVPTCINQSNVTWGQWHARRP